MGQQEYQRNQNAFWTIRKGGNKCFAKKPYAWFKPEDKQREKYSLMVQIKPTVKPNNVEGCSSSSANKGPENSIQWINNARD